LASVRSDIKTRELRRRLQANYVLCKHCLLRQTYVNTEDYYCTQFTTSLENKSECECYICNGLMHETNSIMHRILETLRNNYHFNTFLIGATLPSNLFEREDGIRARMKIRGRENIKSQLTRNLRKKFSEITKKQIDFLHPDLMINLRLQGSTDLDIDIKTRPLVLLGRYIKKNRGMPQRSGGKHNPSDELAIHGQFFPNMNLASRITSVLYTLENSSVQAIISREIARLTKCDGLKFSWVGSEDENSLVLGSGRPFFIQIRNPKTVDLNERRLTFPKYGLFVNIEQFFGKLPEQPIQFIAKTKIVIRASRQMGEEEFSRIKSLANSKVVFRNQKKKLKSFEKRIYSLDIVKKSRKIFDLIVVADGGLAIKQFVEGRECMNPNISAATNQQCECVLFDILDICIKGY
jgi:tRNA pseudouridine synthase 10